MSAHVLVIGEALIDIVHPTSGEITEHVGGSPANVAVGVARLGHRTTLATHVGQDARGRRIIDAISAEGVHIADGSTRAERTPTATALLDETGAATYEFDLDWQVADGLEVPQGDGHLHAGSFSATLEPGATGVRHIVDSAVRLGDTFSYDPNARPSIMLDAATVLPTVEALVALADVVKASDEDVAWFLDGATPDDGAARWQKLGPSLVVVTRGKDGVYVLKDGQSTNLSTAEGIQVIDTVGAGDSLMAGLISGLLDAGYLGSADARERLRQASLDDVLPAVRRGLQCAGITVARAGANPPRRDEIDV